MKKIVTVCIAALVLVSVGLAQDSAAPKTGETAVPSQPSPTTQSAPSAQQTLRIAPGSVIPVQLTKTVDAKKAKSGDEVQAKVTQDLKAGNGELIVPKDTKVMGHVTDAQARTKDQKESQVGITFDHAVMKDGRDVSLPMSIQAIIAPEALNSSNNNSDAEGTGQASPTPNSGGAAGGNGRTSAGAEPPPTGPASSPSEAPNSPNGAQDHQPITGNTQGVVGLSNLKLTAAPQGSVVTSDKNNVKLESGTLLLLRVNQ